MSGQTQKIIKIKRQKFNSASDSSYCKIIYILTWLIGMNFNFVQNI